MSLPRLRLLLLATGDIFLPTFDWLRARPELEIGLLVSQPDRPVGRRLELKSPQVVERARAAGIAVFQPENLRQRREREAVAHAGPFDLGIVMAYGQILTPQLLAVPRLGCWNLHASLLPRHRGAAPIQASLLAGDAETGVTVIQVVPQLDAGPMLHAESLPLRPDHTGGLLHDELATLAPRALQAALRALGGGTLDPLPQDKAAATHVGKLGRDDGRLRPEREGAAGIERRIRAFDPWPGSRLDQSLKPGAAPVSIKLFPPVSIEPTPAGLAPDGRLHPHAARQRLLLPCADNRSVVVDELQLPGKPRVRAADFLRGHGGFGSA